jgi:hypothetical protein
MSSVSPSPNSKKRKIEIHDAGIQTSEVSSPPCNIDTPPPEGFSVEKMEELQCPICRLIMFEVYQCSEGHQICKECIGKLHHKRCPTCRVAMPKLIRTRMVEKLCKDVIIQCRHCIHEYLPYEAMKVHDVECRKPVLKCWHCDRFETKSHTDLLQHLKTSPNVKVIP